MRWDRLFDDLESQLERELTADEADLEAEEERLRLGRLGVRDRLVALQRVHPGAVVAVTLAGGVRVRVHPVGFGRDWFSGDVAGPWGERQCIVPLHAVVGLGLERDQVEPSLRTGADAARPALSDRLGLAFVLRDLCRRRRPVDLVVEGGELHGTIDRVGRDHADLAVHSRDELRRDSAVREVRIVPFGALRMVLLR